MNKIAYEAGLRAPSEVMRLLRMGAAFPTRLSFMRSLIRKLSAQKSEVTCPVWEMDDLGYGRAVYSVTLGGDVYSLVAFTQPLDPENRSDRVIAEAWDAAFALFDGVPSAADLDRLAENAPKQEAGRYEASELSLSRANKSVRFFGHVVDRLAEGKQPDPDLVTSVGYLMRTTAVYGNGKLGFADRARINDRPDMRGSFQVEMLNVWLIRGFTLDLVEHVARRKNPDSFVPLASGTRRNLGIGNSTGLGMAPFLVNHNLLLNNWMTVRETALARVKAIEASDEDRVSKMLSLMARAGRHLLEWNVPDERQMDRIITLRSDWAALSDTVDINWLAGSKPWARLVAETKQYSVECQELAVAMVLEPHGALIDDLVGLQAYEGRSVLDPGMSLRTLKAVLDTNYAWALEVDYDDEIECENFWYVSEAKLEPRFGKRFREDGAELESPLDIGRQAKALADDLRRFAEEATVAEFLMHHPVHRRVMRRVQSAEQNPYSEIHDNLIGADCLPIDMLRFKLAQFGASKFDPKSELWTRINMYQGAPLFDDILRDDVDDWWLPVLGESA